MKTLSDRLYGLKKYYSINRLYCIILLAVSMAITPWLLCSCGGRSAAETGQETEMARELGREQALRLRFGIETACRLLRGIVPYHPGFRQSAVAFPSAGIDLSCIRNKNLLKK